MKVEIKIGNIVILVVDDKIKEHKGYIEDISVWNIKKELAEKIEVEIS